MKYTVFIKLNCIFTRRSSELRIQSRIIVENGPCEPVPPSAHNLGQLLSIYLFALLLLSIRENNSAN